MACGMGCQSVPKQVERPREYSFWPPAPNEPRIQFLTSFNSSADVAPPQSRMNEMLYGRERILPLTKPYGVAMWEGKIYVCDVRSRGITVFDLKEHLAKAVGVGGSMEILRPVDIAVAPDGYKYIVDAGKRAVFVMDPQDHLVQQIIDKDFNPVGVAVYGDELFVSDYSEQTIKVFNRKTGVPLRKIGEAGPDDGQFNRPLAVRVDNNGVLYVADVIKCRVQRFNRDGTFIDAFSRPGNLPGDLARPKHFSFDKNNYLYIADGAFANVQVFDEKQKVVGYFGSLGSYPGAMDLPVGVYVDEDPADLAVLQQYVHPAFEAERLILVTNQLGNDRLSVYAGGHLKPGKTTADIAASRTKMAAPSGVPATTPATRPDFMSEPAR